MIRSQKRRIRARMSMKRARRGFSLIEVMVAMTVFSLVLLSLAKVTTALALRGRTSDLVAKRNAALALEANKFGAMPYARLATWSSSVSTVTRGNFSYSRWLTLTRMSSNRYTVKIVVIPTLDATKKDSVMLDRTQPPQNSLCVSGC
jgi:prepilin-type N-terminal cleavage/methylation domain-containing protein